MNSRIAQRIEQLALLWAVAVALGGAAGCGSRPLEVDGGSGAGGSIPAGGRGGMAGGAGGMAGGAAGAGGACTSSSETLFCLPGSGTTVDTCGDFLVTATCSGGLWVCPAGSGVPTKCRCPGLGSPMCVCTSGGWQCGTGGAGGAGGQSGGGGRGGTGGQSGAGGRGGAGGAAGGGGGAGGGCPSPQIYCVVGSGGTCSDVAVPATCQAGQWVCPQGTVPLGTCQCAGALRPGCVCTASGWQCSTGGAGGRGGAGGQSGGAGGGGRGGAGGGAAGAGGNGPCADATTLEKCDARSDCHSVFVDPGNCPCDGLGCCARFARCADGDRARCTGGAIACDALPPYCELPYVVSYTPSCYEGCVRITECAQ